jgi:hypothetical protein
MKRKSLFSLADAAMELEVAEGDVRDCLADRIVDAEQVSGRWVLTKDQIDDLRDYFDDSDNDGGEGADDEAVD